MCVRGYYKYLLHKRAGISELAYCVFHPLYESLCDKNKNCIKSIGFRVQKHVGDSNLPLDIIHPFNNSKIPPWELIKPDVDMSQSELIKLKQTLLYLDKNWPK